MAPTHSDQSAMAWTPFAIAAIVVLLRMYVRVKTRALNTDDYFMLTALVWSFIYVVIGEILFSSGVPTDQLGLARFWTLNTITGCAGYLSTASSKTSVGVFLLWLLGPTMRWTRYIIVFTLFCLWTGTFFALLATLLAICTPEQLALQVQPGCLSQSVNLAFFQTGNFIAVVADIAFSTLPVYVISKLHMPLKKKIALGFLLGLGWIAAVFVLLRFVGDYNRFSLDANQYIFPLSSILEQNLVMICGSLVTLAPLYRSWKSGKPIRPSNNLRGTTHVGGTKQHAMGKPSMSTVGGATMSSDPRSVDEPAAGIHVQREFDVTSEHA